jgi:anti-sigma factor ChrR (cupin superfamily)
MIRKSILAFAVLAILSSAALAQTAPTMMPAGDMKWMDLDPTGAPGVKVSDVWGDHTKGAFGAFIKFPAGFAAPLHTHTNAYKIVVVSGTFLQAPEGKSEVRLGPGSYLMQPGGGYKHTSACDMASECLFFVQSDGKFDLIPAMAPAK